MVQESAPMPRRKPVRKPPRINFGALTRDALEVMAAAGREVLECHRVVAKTGGNIVGEVLRGQGTFYEWNHYPKGDVYDSETHSQHYYHTHAAGPFIESGLLEELIDQFCNLLRRVLMAVVANAL